MAKAANSTAAAVNENYSSFEPIVEKCDGCDRIVEASSGKVCKTFEIPAAKWKNGICNFATHIKPEIIIAKVKVNPLKASKRASKKK